MDRLAQLQTYTLEELVSEIERRRAEMNQALARIGASATSKSPARSEAARARWAKAKAAGFGSLKEAAKAKAKHK